MTEPTGKRRRTTAAGPVSPRSEVPEPDLTSHEIVGILDASDGEAHVENKASPQEGTRRDARRTRASTSSNVPLMSPFSGPSAPADRA